MKDEVVKALLKKSLITTSDDFTDKLIANLESGKEFKMFNWPLKQILLVIVLFTLIISFLFYTSNLNAIKTPVFVIVTASLFYAINYIMRLNESYTLLTKN